MDSSNWRVKSDTVHSSMQSSPRGSPVGPKKGFGDGQMRDMSSSYGNVNPRRNSHNQSRGTIGSHNRRDEQEEGLRRPVNNAKAEEAIEQGRRLYVGNLPYEATIKDMEKLFKELAVEIEAINMSIDPMTGRNPSYCFVDFNSKELATQVINEYNGREFLRRPLKIRSSVKSGTGTGKYDLTPSQKRRVLPAAADRWSRTPDRLDATNEKRRLYIGNIPRILNYRVVDTQIRRLLRDFNVITVSKLISPRDTPGDTSCYCFVDLEDPGEVDKAITELDGRENLGATLKVNRASGTPKKLFERRRLFVGTLPAFPNQKTLEQGIHELFTGFELSNISKLFWPHEATESRDGSHNCFCFVELADEEQTDKAMADLDGKEMWDGKLRVKYSTSGKTSDASTQKGWRS